MRKDHYCAPAKWTREFRVALKLSDQHFKVLAYLEGGLESHPTGIYFVTLSAIGEMVHEDRDAVAGIMDDLEKIGLILWDRDADVVWVPCVCSEQYRWRDRTPKTTDYRVVEACRHLESLPQTRLLKMFLAHWPVFQLASQGAYQAPTQGAYQAPTQGAYQAPTQAPTPSTCTDSPSDRGSGGTPPPPPKFPQLDENGLDIREADA
jgi:hypothetical protein